MREREGAEMENTQERKRRGEHERENNKRDSWKMKDREEKRRKEKQIVCKEWKKNVGGNKKGIEFQQTDPKKLFCAVIYIFGKQTKNCFEQTKMLILLGRSWSAWRKNAAKFSQNLVASK